MKTKFTEALLLTKSYNLKDFKDWMHWHLDVVGFDCVHVIDNESSVDIKTVCDSYGDRVTYELVKGWVRQYDLYNRYVNTQARAYWVLPIDDDEFLYMKNFTNVNDMLMHYQDKWKDMNKLSIRWKNMFPDDPKADRGDKSLQEFCKNDNEEWAKLFAAGNTVIKTFVRTTGQIIYDERSGQTHNPIARNRASYLCNGERLVGNWYRGPATDDDVKLYHYQYKSAKEWDWKCKNRLAVYGNKPFIYTYGQESIIERMK